MRLFLALLIAAGSLVAAAEPSAAERYRKKRPSNRDGLERPARGNVDSAEHDRAQGCDPAGQYSGYPDWARIAFACGSRR